MSTLSLGEDEIDLLFPIAKISSFISLTGLSYT
jgi:hypothetical protein